VTKQAKETSLLKLKQEYMKRPFLLLLLWLPAQVSISNFSAAVESATTLTVKVEWERPATDKAWSDTVWVFVDHNVGGTMTRLPLTGADWQMAGYGRWPACATGRAELRVVPTATPAPATLHWLPAGLPVPLHSSLAPWPTSMASCRPAYVFGRIKGCRWDGDFEDVSGGEGVGG
jgi:hypothetical protein